MTGILRNAIRSRLALPLLSGSLMLLLAGGVAIAQITWPVSASSGGGGTISPAGAVFVPDGANVTFSFIPDAGYMVYQVLIDGTVYPGGVAGYTIPAVHSQHSILVTFTPVPAVEGYYSAPEIIVPGPFLFGGDFDRRRDVDEFRRRGVESRREAHPEFRGREPAPRGEQRGAPRGGERGGRR